MNIIYIYIEVKKIANPIQNKVLNNRDLLHS